MPRLLFLLLCGWRLACAALLQTSFVPDEYWQAPEIAHRLAWPARGAGAVCWEWRAGLRSPLHPLLLAGVYRGLAALGLASPAAVAVLPRVLQALLLAAADCAAVQLVRRLYSHAAAGWAALLTAFSWCGM